MIFYFGTAELDFKQFWNDRSEFAPWNFGSHRISEKETNPEWNQSVVVKAADFSSAMDVTNMLQFNPRRFLDFEDFDCKIRQESTQMRRFGLNSPSGPDAILVEKAVRLSSH